MWSKLVPVACVVAVGLQGCLFAKFPLAVKVAIGHACDEAADSVSEKEGLKDLAEKEGCDKLNADTLKKLGVENCEDTLTGLIKYTMTFQCEVSEAVELEDVCKEASNECKEKLDSTITEWKSQGIPEEQQEEEEKEGFEAILAIVDHCSTAATTFVGKESDTIEEVCKEEDSASDYKTMGITEAQCPTYITGQLVDLHTIICTLSVLSAGDTPESSDDVTKEFITGKVDDYFAALEPDSAESDLAEADSATTARRIRLFQTVVKGKKWTGRLHQETVASKIAIFGAAATTALVMAAIAVRRLSAKPSDQQEAMLEEIE